MRVPTIQSRRAAAPGPIASTRPTTPTACSVPELARAAIAQRTHRLHPLHQPTTLGELDVDTSFEQHRWRHATRAGDRCPSGALHLVLSAPGAWPSCRGRRPRVADRRWRARFDDEGRAVKKPVMATKDLRFFDLPGAQQLPDGHPRRKMSVVAALSEWRVHIPAARDDLGAGARRDPRRAPGTGSREVWARAAPAVDRIVDALRAASLLPPPRRADPRPPVPGVSPIEGRYLHVEVEGAGVPLLCLHTAGADSRQFRYLRDRRRPRPADNRACPRPSSKGSRDQNSSCPTSPNPGLTGVGASRSAISGPDNRAAGRGVLSPGSGALGTCPDSRSPRRSPWPPTPSPSRGSGPRGWRRRGSGQVLRAAIPAASASGRRGSLMVGPGCHPTEASKPTSKRRAAPEERSMV